MAAINKTGQRDTIESLSRGLEILSFFSPESTELTVVEVSRRLGVSQSTAYRLLQTLQLKGYVRQNPDTRRYALSLRVIELASIILDSMDLRRQALPEMEELVRVVDAKANLAVREGTDLIYLARVESPHIPRMFFHLGKRAPLHATALGKILLAHLSEEECETLLTEMSFTRLTPNTVTSPEQLIKELRDNRARGYSLDLGEYLEGVNCLAVPIFDRTQRVMAALSVSGPASTMTPQRLEELRPAVLRAGLITSHKLGYWA